MIPTVEWCDGSVRLLDQSRLPNHVEILSCPDYRMVVQAIRELKVRGAPAIGVTAALGIALGAQEVQAEEYESFQSAVLRICEEFAATRPTAVNLFWAIERMKQVLGEVTALPVPAIKQRLLDEAKVMVEEDVAVNTAIGDHGATLVHHGDHILTHCNAGALATAGFGTALGVVRAAWKQGKAIRVFADETRPVLQGARLTAWELEQDGIPVTLITDNMAGALMRKGDVQLCVVGADRIAANGDVANKIGTYSVAVLARAHGIPFYVAAPLSTIDIRTPTGEDIPIEQRNSEEVTTLHGGVRVAPAGVEVWNPAFDITPSHYVTGIITEVGVHKPGDILTLFDGSRD